MSELTAHHEKFMMKLKSEKGIEPNNEEVREKFGVILQNAVAASPKKKSKKKKRPSASKKKASR